MQDTALLAGTDPDGKKWSGLSFQKAEDTYYADVRLDGQDCHIGYRAFGPYRGSPGLYTAAAQTVVCGFDDQRFLDLMAKFELRDYDASDIMEAEGSVRDRLERLKDLRDDGVISEEADERRSQEILE